MPLTEAPAEAGRFQNAAKQGAPALRTGALFARGIIEGGMIPITVNSSLPLVAPNYQSSPCGNGCGQVRRWYENAEALAPDNHALIVLQIDAGRDGISLATLEGPQTSEIDEHDVLQVRH